jgi:hypothetical protein
LPAGVTFRRSDPLTLGNKELLMKFTNDLRFAADSLWGNAVPPNHPEPEPVTPSTHPADSAEGANWESAWIDLGGEG